VNLPVIFLTIPYTDAIHSIKKDVKYESGVNIFIDQPAVNVAELYRFLNNFQHHFVVSVSAATLAAADEKLFADVYLLYCLSASTGMNENRIYIYVEPIGNGAKSASQKLKSYFYSQGEMNVEPVAIGYPIQEVLVNNTLFIKYTSLLAMNRELSAKYSGEKINQVIVSMPSNERMAGIAGLLAAAMTNNPSLRSFIELVSLRLESDWTLTQSGLWKGRAHLYLSFISLSKKVGEKQYYDVLDWYKKEYEVLPLWYKRFGHILKWLTGNKKISFLPGGKKLKTPGSKSIDKQ